MCRMFAVFLLAVVCVLNARADQTSLTVSQDQGPGFDKLLLVSAKIGDNDRWFKAPAPPASNLCNYNLYEVQHPDDPRMQVVDVTTSYLAYPADGCAAVPVNLPAPGLPYRLPLKMPLKFGVRYLFTLRDPSNPDPDTNLVVSAFPSAALPSPVLTMLQQLKGKPEVTVKSAVWLKANPGDTVIFQNKSGEKGKGDTNIRGVVEWGSGQNVQIRLTDPLPVNSAGALQLTSQGLTDNYGNDVHAAGKVTPALENTASSTAGQPPSITSAMATMQFSAVAAVHSTPTLSATGALAPWNQAIHMIDVSHGNAVYFDPVVNFDVGTTNSKSANSVIVPSPFTHDFTLKGNSDLSKTVTYSSLNLSFGPREEFDTLYGGTNVLGEARVDLYPSFWYHTAASQKAAIAAGNPAIRDLLQMPVSGWSIAPYFQFDGGGHVTAQTITNTGKNPAAVIPTYDISRLYLGLVFAGTYKSSSVNFDGSWLDLFTPETVPLVVSKVTYAKNVSGWQPHFKGTYSFSIDRTKHYLLTFSWEDGRSAPSFVYLNKATGGLQVVY